MKYLHYVSENLYLYIMVIDKNTGEYKICTNGALTL